MVVMPCDADRKATTRIGNDAWQIPARLGSTKARNQQQWLKGDAMNSKEKDDPNGTLKRSTTSTENLIVEFDQSLDPTDFEVSFSTNGRSVTVRRKNDRDAFKVRSPDIKERGKPFKATKLKYHDNQPAPDDAESVRIVLEKRP